MPKQDEFANFFSFTPDYYLEDFEIIGDDKIAVAVPSDSPPELKRYILAAAKAYWLRFKSVDYVLKRYGPSWNFETRVDKEQKLCKDMLQHVKRKVRETLEFMDKIESKPDRVGLFAAGAALIRLQTSFRAASFLIKRGYNFEALSVCRLILEQIAWAYNIHQLEDERVFEIRPTDSIAKLRNLLPEAGRLYGILSEEAHISPYLAPGYVRFKADGQEIVLTTSEDSISRAFILLLLADAFSIVSEYIYRDLLSTFSCLVRDQNGNCSVNKSRPFSQVVDQYRNELFGQES
jgi:hypothetical protein